MLLTLGLLGVGAVWMQLIVGGWRRKHGQHADVDREPNHPPATCGAGVERLSLGVAAE